MVLIELMEKNHAYALQLKSICEVGNLERKTPIDFFKRGKTDSYGFLHEALLGLLESGRSGIDLSFHLSAL